MSINSGPEGVGLPFSAHVVQIHQDFSSWLFSGRDSSSIAYMSCITLIQTSTATSCGYIHFPVKTFLLATKRIRLRSLSSLSQGSCEKFLWCILSTLNSVFKNVVSLSTLHSFSPFFLVNGKAALSLPFTLSILCFQYQLFEDH